MRQKFSLPLLLTLLVIGGLAAWLFIFRESGVPGQLYRYYPASTGFYLELSPGENMTRRFIAFLDESVRRQEQLSLQNRTETPSAPGKPAEASQKPKPEPLTTQQAGSFRRVFIQKFHSTFKPYFSLGIWPDPTLAPTRENPDPAHILVVFPLKDDNLTLSGLVERFDVTMDDFIQEKFNLNGSELSFITEKNSKTSLALMDRRLLITNTPAAMRAVLGHTVQKMPSVYENPLNGKYLAKLPAHRQGTFILNNTVYGANTLARPVAKHFQPVSQVMPLTVGALQVKNDSFITARFMTPVLLDQIADASVRESLQAVYRARASFNPARQLPEDTSFFVGIAGLDKFYDLYTRTMLPPKNMQMLKGIDYLLTGFRLDLRRDVVGLLENGTVIAKRPVRQSMIVLLQKDDAKQATLDKISAVLATGKLPVRQTTTRLEKTSVNTLTIPDKRKSQVSFAPLNASIAFAPPFDFQALMQVKEGKLDSLQSSSRYRSLMNDLPQEGSLLLYADMLQQTQLLERQLKAQGRSFNQKPWLEGLSLALWSPEKSQDGADLIEGQLNLQLVPYQPSPSK